ncbi:MAG TPA: UDP-N-acetylmuramoyl-L-alanyl-D-glutamate--2,6-diaminopimelate ligase [Solirubrobacterales bacterium]|nr:UDP-N-acetylmuramoyl-L-alanyl-D-glutamate--2,6-diaminopimelate ligase [Solirubrobacterales bacterium]
MELGELLRAARVAAELRGDGAVKIRDLAYDSRRIGPGTLFFCFPGERTDGHDFAPAAVEAGAAALVVERPLELKVPQAQVEDARAAMAPIAATFNGDPTSELGVIGITGTNGKTTTAFLVRHLLESAGHPCGLLGTVQQVVGGQVEEVERTTPEAIDLQRTFNRMLSSGDEYCAMEVSSHALVLHRADAIHFAVKAFTNLSQDHLDFHADMEDYFEAKRLLFSGEGGVPIIELEGGVSVINLDDPYGRRLAEDLDCGSDGECIGYSAGGAEADLSARDVAFDASGSRFTCVAPEGEVEVRIPLPGDFNVANALAALGVARAIGLDLREAAAALASVEQVPGRFESIDEGQPFAVVVDYAHTPDSLENVLKAARRVTEGRLISVFGCGGDRDRDKRPLMGKAGAELSDVAVVTSDNPRSEDPAAIIEQIETGIEDGAPAEVVVEQDRRAAIGMALERAGKGDTVVIAGKGHEQGQEFEGGRKVPFDDRDVAREELQRLAKAAAG